MNIYTLIYVTCPQAFTAFLIKGNNTLVQFLHTECQICSCPTSDLTSFPLTCTKLLPLAVTRQKTLPLKLVLSFQLPFISWISGSPKESNLRQDVCLKKAFSPATPLSSEKETLRHSQHQVLQPRSHRYSLMGGPKTTQGGNDVSILAWISNVQIVSIIADL